MGIVSGDCGKYFCGMHQLQNTSNSSAAAAAATESKCSPDQNGTNCLACQTLDREEEEKRLEESRRPGPSQQMIDSWTWGCQPGELMAG